MDNTADSGAAGYKRRRRRTGGKLPKIEVTTRGELAAVLNAWRWLLEERAAAAMGAPDAAQEALRRTIVKLLAVEEPQSPHALRWMLMTLRDECRAVDVRRRRVEAAKERARQAGAPVDPIAGALIGVKAEAVRRLPRDERDVLTLAAEGLKPREIGALLGVKPKTVSQQLWRARRQVLDATGEPGTDDRLPSVITLPVLSGCYRGWSRGFGERATRILRTCRTAPRSAVSRLSGLLGQVDATQITAATAVLAVVGTWAPNSSSASHPPAITSVVQVRLLAAGGEPNGPNSDAPQTVPGNVPVPTPAYPRVDRNLSLLLPPSGASAETPDDTQFVSVARAPSDSDHQVVVALGVGHICGCRTLFQSVDGERTWVAAPGPSDGEQVALPPAYPRDPRIFVGTDRASGAPASVAPYFGAAFQPVNTMLPPGNVRLSAGFDSGDQRVFVAGQLGVVSYEIGHRFPVPLVAYSPQDPPPALATPPAGDANAALLMGVPATAQLLGVPPALDVSFNGPAPRLVVCGQQTACRIVASIPLANVSGLDVSPGFSAQPVTILAFGYQGLARSTDGGLHFDAVPLPSTASSLVSAALYGQVAWVVTMRSQVPDLARLDAGAAGWSELADDSGLPGQGQLVALSSQRLLYLPAGHGFLCSENGGVSWARGCL